MFVKKSTIGVDLGSHQIKVVQVQKHGDTWKITKCASAPTPAETIKDGVVMAPEALGAALKELLKEAGISATTAHIAAAGGSVFVRPVPFPKMKEDALRKSIRIEASRYVPGSVDESFIEFEILGSIDESRMNVLIVAAPKDIVQTRIRACEAAGLEVDGVDVEMFALYRALFETSEDLDTSSSTLALIDIGAASTTISVIHGGVFAMTRSIPNGARLLTEALQSYFKLEAADAESGKSQLDVRDLLEESGPRENPPLRVLQPHIDELVREIRRSLNYFQSQQSEGADARKIEKLVITGGGSKLIGLADYLAAKLGLPTESLGLGTNPRFVGLPPTDEAGLQFAVATGLAMRPFAKAA